MESVKTFGSAGLGDLARVSTSSSGGQASALIQAGGQDARSVGERLAAG